MSDGASYVVYVDRTGTSHKVTQPIDERARGHWVEIAYYCPMCGHRGLEMRVGEYMVGITKLYRCLGCEHRIVMAL